MKGYGRLTVLIIGLGSMGKRRVRNLRALNIGHVVGFDTREDRRRESLDKYSIETVDSFESGMAAHPDAIVISTPPHRHLEYAWAALDAHVPFFMEANCMLQGLPELDRALESTTLVAAPSRTLWFDNGVRKIKELLDSGALGAPAEFAHHCGHALPLWHPWEDYRHFYGGQPEAKGAGWDMVGFEMYALTYLFGTVRTISALYGKRTSFDTPVDDTFQVLLEFECGTLGSAMIDVVSPFAYRTTRIVSERGVIAWDHMNRRVDLYQLDSGHWVTFEQERGHVEPTYHAAEEMYVEEMDCFLRAVTGVAPYVASFSDEVRVMRAVQAVATSRETGQQVQLA